MSFPHTLYIYILNRKSGDIQGINKLTGIHIPAVKRDPQEHILDLLNDRSIYRLLCS